ncbi:MAG: M48 family metallopeptidase [Chitinophagales bacterium]
MENISTPNFKAIYFDGQSSQGYEAKVFFRPKKIGIVYTISENYKKTVFWHTDLVHQNDINTKAFMQLKYGDFPYESLDIRSENFYEIAKKYYPNAPFLHSNYSWLLNRNTKTIWLVCCSFVMSLVLLYVFMLPKLSDFFVAKMPISYEVELGQSMYESIIEGYDIDEEKTVTANYFFDNLCLNSDYPIEITVVESSMVNAFAIMGGHIVIFDALLNKMEDYEELAALLAHEYAHVKQKHSTRMLVRSLANYLIISLLINDANGITATLLQNAESLKQLNYSRKIEQEADEVGLALLLENQINPDGMVSLFERLQAEQEKLNLPDIEFLSSHPLIQARINDTKSQIDSQLLKITYHSILDSTFQQLKN